MADAGKDFLSLLAMQLDVPLIPFSGLTVPWNLDLVVVLRASAQRQKLIAPVVIAWTSEHSQTAIGRTITETMDCVGI